MVTPPSKPAPWVCIPSGHTTFYASANGSHTIWTHHFLSQRQASDNGSHTIWLHNFLSHRQGFAYHLVTSLSKPASRVRIRFGHTTFKSSVKSSHTIWSHHFLSQHQGFAYDLVTPLSKPASRVRTTSCHPSF